MYKAHCRDINYKSVMTRSRLSRTNMDYLCSPIAVVKTTRRVAHVRTEVEAPSKIGAAGEHIPLILVRALGVP